MFLSVLHSQVKMVREVIKVSFLVILLLQFHTGSYNFLHATGTNIESGLRLKSRVAGSTVSKSNNSFHQGELEDSGSEYNIISIESDDGGEESIEISTKMDPDQIMRFEKKLLKLVGMKNRPKKVGNPVKIPKYLSQLYDNQLDSEILTSNLNLPGRFARNANTIRSFYNSGKEAKLSGLHTHLRFDLSSIPDNEEITGAELRVPFSWDKQHQPTTTKGKIETIQILVHDVVKIPKGISSGKPILKEPITYPIDSKSVKLSETKTNSSFWLTFDVFPAVSRWTSQKSKRNLALAIDIVGRNMHSYKSLEMPMQNSHIRVRRSTPDSKKNSNDSEPNPTPMLLTYSDDGHNPRKTVNAKTLSRNYRSFQNQRRRRNHRHKNRRRNICSRKKMFVDFTDVGWNDWIVAPPGYQAYFCSGECPFPMAEHLNATNHAVIQALVNSMNPRLVPPPCCVPNKYSSLSLLYTDSSDRIVLKNYNEMVVDSCGCN